MHVDRPRRRILCWSLPSDRGHCDFGDRPKQTYQSAATRDVRQLMLLMDKDGSGTVSKQEFMDFMSQTFDRLDVDHSRQLVARRVAPLDEAGLDDGAACGTRPCALTGSAASVAARWLCGRSIGVGPDACRRVAAATPRSR